MFVSLIVSLIISLINSIEKKKFACVYVKISDLYIAN